MGNPCLEDMDPTVKELTDVDPKDNVACLDDFQLRANPTCKTLQQDLAKVHNIVRVTNAEILKSVSDGYEALTKLLTDSKEGVYTRLKSLEQSTSTYSLQLSRRSWPKWKRQTMLLYRHPRLLKQRLPMRIVG